jgi:hypothetical protein
MGRSAAIVVTTILALGAPCAALANAPVALESAVFIERQLADSRRSLEPASRLSRGDRVVTIVSWRRIARQPAGGGFTVVNPLPRAIAWQGSAREGEEVSVDGGRSWGTLETLRVGTRMATAEDVTHVRWRVAPQEAARGQGRIAYAAIVR